MGRTGGGERWQIPWWYWCLQAGVRVVSSGGGFGGGQTGFDPFFIIKGVGRFMVWARVRNGERAGVRFGLVWCWVYNNSQGSVWYLVT